jgi:hypothetical protein
MENHSREKEKHVGIFQSYWPSIEEMPAIAKPNKREKTNGPAHPSRHL